MAKTKLLVGDIVVVIAGSHKGKTGPIKSIAKNKKTVSIQGIDVVKHVKPSQSDTEGGIKEVPAKISISNVAIQDPKNKDSGSRIGYEIIDGRKTRVAKKSATQLKKASK